jgi:PAS domain-containing protein
VLWVAILTLLLFIGQALPAAKFFSSPASYIPMHTVLEFFAMAVSAMVFALAWSLRRQSDNSHLTLLGTGFLAVCLIDIAHTLSYAGMPALVTPSGPEKAINFWLAGRYTAAAIFLAVALLPLRKWSLLVCNAALLFAVVLAGTVWWVGLNYADVLPRTFIPGQGLTGLKIGAEYLLAVIYGGAAILIYLKSQRSQDGDLLWLAAAAWVQGLAELFFTLYADVTDMFNLLGHIYKVFAYMMVYRALFVAGVLAPYRQLDFERSRLHALFSTIPDLIWLKDSNGVYLACNPGFYAQTGGNFRQLINRQFLPRWHPSQSGAACLGMHSDPGNADAATPPVKSA